MYNLDYNGLVFAKKFDNFGKKEMEVVKKNITVDGAVWDKNTGREFKVKRGSLVHDAVV